MFFSLVFIMGLRTNVCFSIINEGLNIKKILWHVSIVTLLPKFTDHLTAFSVRILILICCLLKAAGNLISFSNFPE